jgi:putative glutamine amidotransferase
MLPPIIGIIPSRKVDPPGAAIYILEAYIQAVASAGGAPLVIPLGLPEDTLAAIAQRLDGVLFSGGGDVHPDRYGGAMHPKVDQVDPDRDRVELFIFQEILRSQMPFLGICRGYQVINVALGGNLYEDVLDLHPAALDHRYQPGASRAHLAHPVAISPGSRLACILDQERVLVNSMHHQGVRLLAPSLRNTAVAPDGLIEAFELPDHPFGLAVQWHPECLQEHSTMQRLFQAFIRAAGEHRSA